MDLFGWATEKINRSAPLQDTQGPGQPEKDSGHLKIIVHTCAHSTPPRGGGVPVGESVRHL